MSRIFNINEASLLGNPPPENQAPGEALVNVNEDREVANINEIMIGDDDSEDEEDRPAPKKVWTPADEEELLNDADRFRLPNQMVEFPYPEEDSESDSDDEDEDYKIDESGRTIWDDIESGVNEWRIEDEDEANQYVQGLQTGKMEE